MKKIFYLSLLFLGLNFMFVACSDDDKIEEPKYEPATVSIEANWADFSLPQDDTITFSANVTSTSPIESYSWKLNGKEVSTEDEFSYIATELGTQTLSLTVSNAGDPVTIEKEIKVYGKFRDGVFVINEGSTLSGENGSITFISPKGQVIDSAYWKVNGTEIGNVSQDIAYYKGELYIVSQNGATSAGNYPSDGALVVADAETLKKKDAYSSQEVGSGVNSWPTHVAIANGYIYVRGNGGISLFDKTTRSSTLIEGTNGAAKNTMATIGNKVFAAAGKKVLVLQDGEVVHTMGFEASVSGVVKSSDGNLWVSTVKSGQINSTINKIDPKTYNIIKTNTVTEINITASFAAASGIAAKGDTIYYSGLGTKIYRHLFKDGTTTLLVDAKTMVEDANIVYNTVSVHPVTGYVYMNTIKGYGQNYKINNINVFDFRGAEPKLHVQYSNHTRYPAGVFFTDNFDRE